MGREGVDAVEDDERVEDDCGEEVRGCEGGRHRDVERIVRVSWSVCGKGLDGVCQIGTPDCHGEELRQAHNVPQLAA